MGKIEKRQILSTSKNYSRMTVILSSDSWAMGNEHGQL
jgi:hypothetical protein